MKVLVTFRAGLQWIVGNDELLVSEWLASVDHSDGWCKVAVRVAGTFLKRGHATFKQGDDGAGAGLCCAVDGGRSLWVEAVVPQRGHARAAVVDVDPVDVHPGGLLLGYRASAQAGEDEVDLALLHPGKRQLGWAWYCHCGADGVVFATDALGGDGWPRELGEGWAADGDIDAWLAVATEEAGDLLEGLAHLWWEARGFSELIDLIQHVGCWSTEVIDWTWGSGLGGGQCCWCDKSERSCRRNGSATGPGAQACAGSQCRRVHASCCLSGLVVCEGAQ